MKTFYVIGIIAGIGNICLAIKGKDLSEAFAWFAATMGLVGFLISDYQNDLYEGKN